MTLTACGGGSSSDAAITLGGTVSGLSKGGLVLSNGTDTLSVAAGATTFTFATSTSGDYAVKVKAQPIGQTCSVSGASGSSSSAVDSVVVACRGYRVYVTNSVSASVGQFSIDTASGTLAALPTPQVGTVFPPVGIAVSSDGLHAYTVHSDDKGVSSFSVDSNGALTLLASTNAFSESRGLALSADGAYAYVANFTDKSISQLGIDSSTGALTTASSTRVASGSTPVSVAVTPNGSFAYVVNAADSTISQYSVASGGALVPLTPTSATTVSTTSTGTDPMAIAIDPLSRYAYVTLADSAKVLQYTIAATGVLTPMSPASVTTGTGPRGIAVSASGNCAYVANRSSNTVSGYLVAGGALVATAPASVAAGTSPAAVAISPDGKYVFVANSGSSTISQYSIDSSCALTAVATIGSGGVTPVAIVVR
ncbi:MAG: hypothetical protein JWQ11_3148 [Rhizobacter sp.]|nr:hypothetical protein [Rhizobacter sp.]